VEMLRVGAQARQKALGLQSPAKAEPEDPETAEIQRLEKLEKESPDLLRAFDQAGYNALHTAAKMGQNRVVEHLLSRGFDINQPAPNSLETALHRAVRAGRLTMVDLLLKRGADVNSRNRWSETAIHLAINQKYPLIIDRLLQAKPDLNVSTAIKGNDGRTTPLSLAVVQGDTNLLKHLLAEGANIAQPAGIPPVAYTAIINGNAAALEVLLNAGADVHERYDGNRPPGMTLLHHAVLSDNLAQTLPLLMAKKANIDAQTLEGLSPLFYAIWEKTAKTSEPSVQRVLLLLKAGANPNLMAPRDSPLTAAIIADEECVKPLLDAKADPNLRPPLGTFPIIYALGSEVSTEALGMLLEAGANPNVRGMPRDGNPGSSALDLAIDRRNAPKLEILLKHGADPNRRNAQGETPLEHLQKDNGLRNAPRRRPGSLPPPGTLGPSGEIEPGQAASKESSIAELAEVLRKAGAREDLPDFNSIKVGRRSTATTALRIVFDSEGLNQITLLEAIAMAMNKISALSSMKSVSEAAARNQNAIGSAFYRRPDSLAWPDWQKVTISRPASDGLSWSTIPVNPDVLLKPGSCDEIPLLQRGDVVDIPEAVHELGFEPSDPSVPLWPAYTNCIYSAHIAVVTPGSTNLLGKDYPPRKDNTIRPSGLTDWIRSAVLRSSSDVSRVTVRRAAFRGEPAWVRTFDLTFDSPEQVDLFLRDGDVIEVPDLIPATSGVTPAKARVFGALHGTLILPEGQVTRLSEIATRFGRNDAADLKNVKLYRTDPQSGYVDTIEADVEKILRTNDPAADLELRNGDRIEVPRK
jgi:ankyrin repeat protein